MHTARLAHKPVLPELLAEPECFRAPCKFALNIIELAHYRTNFTSGFQKIHEENNTASSYGLQLFLNQSLKNSCENSEISLYMNHKALKA